MVHNAGITRDRTLARMSEDEWDSVLAVNLESIERINDGCSPTRVSGSCASRR